MELHWAPASSITTVQYVDSDGDTQTLADSVYELGTKNGMGVLRLKYGQTWPTTRSHEDVVIVTYKAGYGGEPADVPQAIKDWIMTRAAWRYESREGEEKWPEHVDSLLTGEAAAEVIA